jgi:hypothetical protein
MMKKIKTSLKLLRWMHNEYPISEIPICSNCLHFIETPEPTLRRYGRCKKFGDVNIVSGELKYELAKNCRDSIDCGLFGSEYIDKNQL